MILMNDIIMLETFLSFQIYLFILSFLGTVSPESQTGLGLKIYQRITHDPPPTSEGLASQEYTTISCMKEEEMHLSFIVHCNK